MAKIELGFSFSHRQCQWLGLDPEQAFRQLVATTGLNHCRLSVYWDEVEIAKDTYNFELIQKQLQLCAQLGVSAIVSVGVKAQRYPEFYLPAYLAKERPRLFSSELNSNRRVRERILALVRTAVTELKDEPALKSWQIENEPLDPSGPKHWHLGLEFLQTEIALLLSIDSTRPVILNLWGNNFPQQISVDSVNKLTGISRIAFDIYPKQAVSESQPHQGPRLTPAELFRQFSQPMLVELQAEPWEGFDYRQQPESVTSISVEQIATNLTAYAQAGFNPIYLWGAEYWIWSGILPQVAQIIAKTDN